MQFPIRMLCTAVALAALSVPAQAALIFNGSFNNAHTNAYIGNLNAATADTALFSNGTLGLGAFTNTWVFNFSGNGSITESANFVPGFPNPNAVNNFLVSLYAASASGGCTASTISTAGLCTGLSLGSLIAGGSSGTNKSDIASTTLASGMYALVVTGTVVSTPVLYSGLLSSTAASAPTVPEPSGLALAGLAMCGLAAVRHSRKA